MLNVLNEANSRSNTNLKLNMIITEFVVMVGDYLFDLQAGRNAKVATIHLDPAGNFAWPKESDICIRQFSEIDAFL